MKKIISALLSAALISALYVPVSFAEETMCIYVDVKNGDDSAGNGKIDAPYKTVQRGFKDVAAARGSISKGTVQVILREGIYSMDSLQIDSTLSGTDNVTVELKGYDGEYAKITAANSIDTNLLKKVDDNAILSRIPEDSRDKIYQLNLKEAGINFSPVYDAKTGNTGTVRNFDFYWNDKVMDIARWPNADEYTKTASVTLNDKEAGSIGFTMSDDRILRWKTAENPYVHGFFYYEWMDSIMPIASINTENKEIKTQGYPIYGAVVDRRFFVFNLLEEIDSPGEYYLDKKSGILYLYPDGDINSADFSYVCNNQSSLLSLTGVKNFKISNLNIGGSTSTGVNLNTCDNIRIENCRIFAVSKTGIQFGWNEQASTNCTVYGCDIYDIGCRAIAIQSGDTKTLTPGNVVIENNNIHRFAQKIKTYEPGVYLLGVGNTVRNNLIHDAPHMCIHFSGNENVIEYNEIFDAIKETGDAGLIYGGRSFTARNYIRNNLFHDMGRGTQLMTIYCDDNMSGTQIENNTFIGQTAGIAIGGGRWTKANNNLFLDKGWDGNGAGIKLDERGVNFAREYLIPSDPNSQMMKDLYAIPYNTGIWAEKYPWLSNIVEDNPEMPKYNEVKYNVMANAGKVEATALNVEYGDISNNYEIGPVAYEIAEDRTVTILEPEKFDSCDGFELDKLELDKIGVYGDGNYDIPKHEYVKTSGQLEEKNESKPAESVMREGCENIDVGDLLLSNKNNWDTSKGSIMVNGDEVEIGTGKVGYKASSWDNISARFKVKLGEDVDWLGVELRSGSTSEMPWSGAKSYLFILKPRRFELQRWYGNQQMLDEKDNYYYKDADSWMNVEFRTYTADDGKVYIKVRLNGMNIFDTADANEILSLKDPGYLNLIVVGKSGAKSVIGEFDEAYNVIEQDEEIDNTPKTDDTPKQKPIKVMVDGKKINLPTGAYIKNNRTMVPMRAIFEALGAMVDWNGESRRITSTKDTKRILMHIDNPIAYVNGVEYALDAIPEIVDNSTMIGARFVAEALEANVDWDPTERTVSIKTKDYKDDGDTKDDENENPPKKDDEKTEFSDKREFDKEKLVSHKIEKADLSKNRALLEGDRKRIDELVKMTAKEDSYYVRSGLSNFKYKLEETKEKLNVVFLGGSITEGNYYRAHMCDWLEQTYGKRFNFVNSGYGGTGSTLGNARYSFDVLDKKPDLVFIEFAVNDTNPKPSAVAMESLVRRTWNVDDTIDIVFLYTVQEQGLESAQKGEWTPVAKAQDYVAKNYNIPSVFMGTEAVEKYQKGEIAWNAKKNPNNLEAFTVDGTHPTNESSIYYFNVLKEAFEKMISDAKPDTTEGKTIFAENYGDTKVYSPSDFAATGEKSGADYEIWKNRTDKVYMLSKPGDSITVEFTGTECSILVISGGDCAMVDVEADGKKIGPVDIFMPYHGVTTYGLTTVSSGYLGGGEHKVTFSVSDKIQDKAARINEVTHNAAQIELIGKMPEFYGSTNLIIGAVLVNGEKK